MRFPSSEFTTLKKVDSLMTYPGLRFESMEMIPVFCIKELSLDQQHKTDFHRQILIIYFLIENLWHLE